MKSFARYSILFIAIVLSVPQPSAAQIGGLPGAFSRLGFGARGMGMANTLGSTIAGDVAAYYNPALLPWAEYRFAQASVGILSLDRKLNFISVVFPVRPRAGFSLSIINSGVSNIDGRNNAGDQTGALQTSENQFAFSFGVMLSSRLSAGVNLKFYYYHLYTDISSATIGSDFGILYAATSRLRVSVTLKDIGSQYKWDSSKLFGQSGVASNDPFPLLYTIGASYLLPDSLGLVAVEVGGSDAKTFTGRIGVEIPLVPELTVRAGLDRIDLKDSGNGIRPSFGFSLRRPMEGWTPTLHYALVVEPFTASPTHMISLSVAF